MYMSFILTFNIYKLYKKESNFEQTLASVRNKQSFNIKLYMYIGLDSSYIIISKRQTVPRTYHKHVKYMNC